MKKLQLVITFAFILPIIFIAPKESFAGECRTLRASSPLVISPIISEPAILTLQNACVADTSIRHDYRLFVYWLKKPEDV